MDLTRQRHCWRRCGSAMAVCPFNLEFAAGHHWLPIRKCQSTLANRADCPVRAQLNSHAKLAEVQADAFAVCWCCCTVYCGVVSNDVCFMRAAGAAGSSRLRRNGQFSTQRISIAKASWKAQHFRFRLGARAHQRQILNAAMTWSGQDLGRILRCHRGDRHYSSRCYQNKGAE